MSGSTKLKRKSNKEYFASEMLRKERSKGKKT